MPPEDWIEHRRAGDRERLGWIRPDGDGFVAVDALGRELTDVVDWLDAEEALDAHGLHWLADLWQLDLPDGTRERVRIVEVTPARVVVKVDDFGAVDVVTESYVLPFPAPESAGPFEGDAKTITAGSPAAEPGRQARASELASIASRSRTAKRWCSHSSPEDHVQAGEDGLRVRVASFGLLRGAASSSGVTVARRSRTMATRPARTSSTSAYDGVSVVTPGESSPPSSANTHQPQGVERLLDALDPLCAATGPWP